MASSATAPPTDGSAAAAAAAAASAATAPSPPLSSLSRAELEERYAKLEARLDEAEQALRPDTKSARQKKRPQRPFDFSGHNERHVALRIAYLGERYHGLARQDTTEETVEAYLIRGLIRTCLISSIDTCGFSRCGRTDKGVSALGQVISLRVRTRLRAGRGVITSPTNKHSTATDDKDELDFPHLLNKVLPPDIRCTAWAPVGFDFDARFSALHRTYKYYFLGSGMDVERMQEAANMLVGEYDFRNFCKKTMVQGEEVSYIRRVLSFDISKSSIAEASGDYQLYEATITGFAFLWHQVRCMMAVLFLVGRGLEQPEIVRFMLNTAECTRKPKYQMASELPLVLYDCGYEDVKWRATEHNVEGVHAQLHQMWAETAIRGAMLRGMMGWLDGVSLPAAADGRPALWGERRSGRQLRPPKGKQQGHQSLRHTGTGDGRPPSNSGKRKRKRGPSPSDEDE